MNSLPDYVYSKAFWESISLSAAGLIGLLIAAGVLPVEYAIPSASIFAGILAILRAVRIEPEVRGMRAERQAKVVKKTAKK